jgi:hypothetical protein
MTAKNAKEPPAVLPDAEAESPVVATSNGDTPPQDPDYFYLSSPITVDGKEFTRLRMNPKGILKGREFFRIVDRYQRKFPDEARSSFNKFTSENFLSLVLAEINKPLTPEDLYKLDYVDLPLLFLQAASFHFSGGARKAATPEDEESPKTP